MTTAITAAGVYPAGDYHLANDITTAITNALTYEAAIKFTGIATLNKNGKKLKNTGGSGTLIAPVLSVGIMSDYALTVYDTKGTGVIEGFRIGAKFNGAGSISNGVNYSKCLYMGPWFEASDGKVLGGHISDIGGVVDESYAVGVQIGTANNCLVDGVTFKNIYSQAGYLGVGPVYEGLAVNFSANCTNCVMRNCTFINDRAEALTIGAFTGGGGGHLVEYNLFVNCVQAGLWSYAMGANAHNRNVMWLKDPAPVGADSHGVKGDAATGLTDNLFIGYAANFDTGVNGNGNYVGEAEYLAPPASSGTGVVLTNSNADWFGNIEGKTFKLKIASAGLSLPAGAVTKMRFKLKGYSAEGINLSGLYVGNKASSGDAYDATALTQIMVGGVGAIAVAAGAEVWTDWVTFTPSGDIILSGACPTGAAMDRLSGNSANSHGTTYLKPSVNEAALANATGYAAYPNWMTLISAIETDGHP